MKDLNSSKLAAFVSNAYKIPSGIQERLIDKFDSVDERNIATIYVCFSKYLFEVHRVFVQPTAHALEAHSDKFDNFLACAVLLTTIDPNS